MNEEEKINAPVEETTPEIPNTVLPPETNPVVDEPVMIAENIDEMTQEELAAIKTNASNTTPTEVIPTTSSEAIPVDHPTPMEVTPPETTPSDNPVEPSDEPVIPAEAPSLGGPESGTEETTVPAFQQFPTPEESTATEENQTTEPTDPPTNLMDMFQTGTQSEPSSTPESSFQQMPDIPTETPSTMDSSEDKIVTDDYDEEVMEEEKIKKKKRIFPLLLIIVLLALVIAVGVFVMKPKASDGQIKMLRPERATNSNMNIAVLGDKNTPTSAVVSSITKKYATEVKEEYIEQCSELEEKNIKFKLNTYEIKADNEKLYNINYPCDFDSAIRYLSASEGDRTVDGAILVVSSKEGITDQIKNYINALKGFGMDRIVIYLTTDGDAANVETEIIELLEKEGLNGKNTPIVTGELSDEQTISTLITKVGNWISKDTSYKQPSIVPGYNNLIIHTVFLTKEEGGLQEELKDYSNLSFIINEKKYRGTVTLEEGRDSIHPGDIQKLNVVLDTEIPMIKKMRVLVKQEDTLIGIGVISELK